MIAHNKPTLGKQEQQSVSKVLESGYIAQGSEVEEFEDGFCGFLGVPKRHAVALSSGTSALFMALWVLDAKDKSVAMPAYVCSALRNAVAMAQAKEILVDNAKGELTICLNQLQDSGADIAIIPHTFGLPSKVQNIKNMRVIEDCAQSLGASIDGIQTGLIGEVGIFSFYATKLMTSGGQGGMFVSKDKNLVDKVRDYRDFDCRKDKKHRFNFQMTDIQAAIGRVQLKKLPKFLLRRKEIFTMYAQSGLNLLNVGDEGSIYYRAILKIQNSKYIQSELLKKGIKTIVPIEDWELLDDGFKYENSYNLTQTTLSLPIYPSLKNEEVEYIIEQLNKIIK